VTARSRSQKLTCPESGSSSAQSVNRCSELLRCPPYPAAFLAAWLKGSWLMDRSRAPGCLLTCCAEIDRNLHELPHSHHRAPSHPAA
jgi:hypothetical protein